MELILATLWSDDSFRLFLSGVGGALMPITGTAIGLCPKLAKILSSYAIKKKIFVMTMFLVCGGIMGMHLAPYSVGQHKELTSVLAGAAWPNVLKAVPVFGEMIKKIMRKLFGGDPSSLITPR